MDKQTLSPDDLGAFAQTIRAFFKTPPFCAGGMRVRDMDNRDAVCALSLQHTQAEQTYSTLSRAIAGCRCERSAGRSASRAAEEFGKDLQNRLTTTERKLTRIREDITDAGRADQYERMGNLLMCHLAQIPSMSNPSPCPTCSTRLAQRWSFPSTRGARPSENASDYLKRARKARTGAPILGKRLEIARQEKDKIQHYLDRLNAVQSEDELDSLRRELEDARLIRKPKKRSPAQSKRQPGDIHPRRYRTRDGWRVLVGRNNAGKRPVDQTLGARRHFPARSRMPGLARHPQARWQSGPPLSQDPERSRRTRRVTGAKRAGPRACRSTTRKCAMCKSPEARARVWSQSAMKKP